MSASPSTPPSSSKTDFQRALVFTLKYEGGFVDDKDDPGGRTNFGVTQAVYNGWRRAQGLPQNDVLKIARSEVEAIYKNQYWDEAARGRPWPLNAVCFDIAVNHGQKNLDLMLGDVRAQVKLTDPDRMVKLAHLLIERRRKFYHAIVAHWRSIGKPRPDKYLNGWLSRADALERFIT